MLSQNGTSSTKTTVYYISRISNSKINNLPSDFSQVLFLLIFHRHSLHAAWDIVWIITTEGTQLGAEQEDDPGDEHQESRYEAESGVGPGTGKVHDHYERSRKSAKDHLYTNSRECLLGMMNKGTKPARKIRKHAAAVRADNVFRGG